MKINIYSYKKQWKIWVLLLILILFAVKGNYPLDFNWGITLNYQDSLEVVEIDTIAQYSLSDGTTDDTKAISQPLRPRVIAKDYLIPKPYLEHLWGVKKTSYSLSTSSILQFQDMHRGLIQQQHKKHDIPFEILMAELIYHSECGNSQTVKRYTNYFDIRSEDKSKYIIYETRWSSVNNHSLMLLSFYNSNVKPTNDDWLNWSFDLLDKEPSERVKYIKQINLIMKMIK